jgi:hypothetical protein
MTDQLQAQLNRGKLTRDDIFTMVGASEMQNRKKSDGNQPSTPDKAQPAHARIK